MTPGLRQVLLALLPGAAVQVLVLGPRAAVVLALTVGSALLLDAGLRRRRAGTGTTDGAIAVGAALLGLSLPPTLPLAAVLAGAALLVLLRHLQDHLPFPRINGAMAVFVVLALTQADAMTRWLAAPAVDALSSATPLAYVRAELAQARTVAELARDDAAALFAGLRWGWINVAFFAGGLWLVRRRRSGLRLPLAVLGGVFLAALPGWLMDPDRHLAPLDHLFAGATMLGAFFIATDPATAPREPRIQLAAGLAIGGLTVLFRSFSTWPDGMAFAVVLTNLITPVLRPSTPTPVPRPAAAIGALLALGLAAALVLPRERLTERPELLLPAVLPPGYDNDPASDTVAVQDVRLGSREAVTVYRARQGQRPHGAAFTVTAPGYAGSIRLLVGVTADGRISGVRVLSHHETLAQVQDAFAAASPWLAAFTGGSLSVPPPERWTIGAGGGFDAISGATISARAVVTALRQALEVYATQPAAFLPPRTVPSAP